MSAREIRIEELLGAMVRDADGRSVGRIEEIRAVPDGDGLVVTHYLLGPAGWRERLSLRFGLRTLRGVGRSRLQRLPWSALDVADPRRPRLRISPREAASTPAGRAGSRRPPRSTSRSR